MVNAEHYHPEYDLGPSYSELAEQQERAIREVVRREGRDQETIRAEASRRGVSLAAVTRERFSRMDQKQELAKADGSFSNRLLALRKSTSDDDAWEQLDVDGVRVNIVSLGRIGEVKVLQALDGTEISTTDNGMRSKIIFSATELEALLIEEPQLREPYINESGEPKRIIYSIVNADNQVWILTE